MTAKRHRDTIGIDLGGTSIRVGLFDAAMNLLSSHSMPTRVAAGPQAAVDEIADANAAAIGEWKPSLLFRWQRWPKQATMPQGLRSSVWVRTSVSV